MTSSVSLSSSARANLNSLQDTASMLSSTQQRLASGKKVNSALDNATSYFASTGFLNRSSDLSRLKDSMATALQTIKAASNGLTAITNIVNQAQGLTTSALQTTDTATRSAYASQFNSLRTQIDAIVNDSVFNGTNLLSSSALPSMNRTLQL